MRIQRLISTLLCVLVAAVLGVGAYTFFKDMEGPAISISPDMGRVSPTRELAVVMNDPSKIRSVVVSVRKNAGTKIILKKDFSSGHNEEKVVFSLKDANLQEGTFDLEIKATDASLAGFGQGNSRTRIWPMRMDAQPPRVAVKTLPPNVRRGGTGVIRYSLNEETSRSGVRVGDLFFQGFLQPDGTYVCFFAFPHTLTPAQFMPEILVEDLAGNTTVGKIAARALDRAFKQDRINITDDYLNKVSLINYDLAPDAPNPLERFLQINRDVRKANVEFLRELKNDTDPRMLWSEAFLRLPRSAARAGFADHRSYFHQGRKIDDQHHLGFDLASLPHADVPAGNNGRVVFVGNLGIYGLLVVIDHGLGLMSLYSHLSAADVAIGDVVHKGSVIGRTGTSGMAFGDHLHFGIVVGGVEVTPLEWLDSKWIKDNVTDRLAQAQ